MLHPRERQYRIRLPGRLLKEAYEQEPAGCRGRDDYQGHQCKRYVTLSRPGSTEPGAGQQLCGRNELVMRRMEARLLAVAIAASVSFAFAAEIEDADRWDMRGGIPTTHEDYPFPLFIRIWPGACVGALVRRNWILTAAHCVSDPDTNSMEVIWGWP